MQTVSGRPRNGSLALLLEIPGGGSADVVVDVNGFFE